MSVEIRRSGIDILGEIPWGTHFCQFYRTPKDLLDILVPYFAAGLQANEFCMWITSEPLNKAAAERALADAVPDLAERIRNGQIEILPHSEWYLAGGQFDSTRVLEAWAEKLRGARARGFDGLRLSGNTFWLEKEDWEVFTDYEAAVDKVIGQARMLALCTYSLDKCGANEVLDVVRNHRFALVRREGAWELIESTERERARLNERRLAQFPQENPHPVLRVDENGALLYANPSARGFLTAAGAAAGGPLPPVLGQLAAQAFEREENIEAEVGDGAGRTYTFTAVKPPEEAYVNLYACDVTTRALAETALRESEAKYRSLFESMTEGFALYELIENEEGRAIDWRIIEVNEAYSRHTGMAREAIAGRRVSELFPATYAEYLPTFARVVATGIPADFETYAKAVDRYMHIVTFPLGGRRFASIIEDISARRKAEAALKVEEERYRALFNNMTEGFALHEIVTDAEGRAVDYVFIDVNPAFERLTGLCRDDVTGRRVSEVLKGIEPDWIETYGRVALTGEPLKFERYYPEPLNRWFEIFAYRPAPRQFAVVFMDITQRRRAEEALRESEKRLERSQEIAHLGSWELDVDSDRLTWSDEVYRIFGLEPRGFPATYEAFLAAVHPDDRPTVDGAYLGSIREGSNGYEIEHRIVRRDTGEVRTVHEKCEHIRNASGRIVRSVGMVHDITDRKRTESLRQALAEQERLRLGAAVELATEAVVMAEPGGRILYVNTAFETIHRLAKDAAVGRNYFDLVAGDVPAAEMRAAVGRGDAWNGHITLKREGERAVALEVVATAFKEPPGILFTERDITQEVTLQEQVRQSQKMEALGTLAGGVAHDFNNILGAITINAELALLETEQNCPARESLPLILRAAERGKELVKQIVTFSRQKEWERSALRITPVVREAMELFRPTVPGTIAVHETIGAEGATVLAHPAQVHQVLSNLCQNACLAMRDKPGRLEVKLDKVHVDAAMASRHAGLKPGPYVRLAVGDSGCGMPQEVLSRVFEPFFTTRSPGEGSGLGLAVVHGIVRSYGGAITAYSEVGKGSTFSVFLPLLPDDAQAAETLAAPAAETGSERILLVDDDAVQLKSLARMLGKLGYKVSAYPSGRTAAAAFKRKPDAFDLVVTDQTMPRMTGIELARSLVAMRPDIPIILNTGFSEKVNGETVGQYGIRAFIMKPFTSRELSSLIRKVLRGK